MDPTRVKDIRSTVPWTDALAAAFLIIGLVAIQVLIGGTRLVFSLPAFGLLGFTGVLSIFSLRHGKPNPDQICLWTAVIFFGYVVGRAIFSPVPYLGRADVYSVLGGLVVYFFIACVLVQARARMFVLLGLLVAGAAHVVVGAIQFRNGDNFMPISFLQRFDYERRASGFYICPNHLAGLLEVVGIFGVAIAIWSRWPAWAKLCVGYLALVCYAGLVLTGSRGGYLSCGISLLVFLILSVLILRQIDPKLSWRIGVGGFIAFAIAGICCISLVQKNDYLSGRAGNVFETGNIRFDFWQAALQQWRLAPVLGTGAETYLFYGRQFRTDRVQMDPVDVHNDYLQLLAEYGAVGALAFALFFWAHLRRGWRSFQRVGPRRLAFSSRILSNAMALNVASLCAVAAYVVHSFVDFNLHIPANVLVLALVFGVLANPGIEPTDRRSPRPGAVQIGWRLVLPALSALVALQCVRLLPAEYFSERARIALRDFHPVEAIAFALRGLRWETQNPDLYNYLGRARLVEGYRLVNPIARASFYETAIDALWKGGKQAGPNSAR